METKMSHYSSWWKGIDLWYNDGDYLAAISCWREWLDDCTESGLYSVAPHDPKKFRQAVVDILQPSHALTDAESQMREDEILPLLIFVAGCYLDAKDFDYARLCLYRVLRSCVKYQPTASDRVQYLREIAARAVSELIASYEEDESVQEPWKYAKQLVQIAIDHSIGNWKHASQRPGFVFPLSLDNQLPTRNVAANSVYSENPPWCKHLEENYLSIRAEFQKLHGASSNDKLTRAPEHWPMVGAGDHRGGAGQHDGSVVIATDENCSGAGEWREMVLFGSGARPQCSPFTAQLLRRIAPDAVSLADAGGGEIIFSVLAPRTRILPHCGSINIRLTAHLGLVIPKDSCSIRVDDSWHHWEEGRVLVFDDSYEHEVRNDSDEIRVVLLLRFWHPDLPVHQRTAALDEALRSKQEDEMKRFNPPVPISHGAVQDRGMERSHCPCCSGSGFQSIRLVAVGRFHCVCGTPIE